MKQTVSIIVSGIVQGVFYRQSVKEFAEANGITGETKNNTDGTVSIIASGTPAQLQQLTAWCRKGPRRAVVSGVRVEEMTLQEFSGFRIIR